MNPNRIQASDLYRMKQILDASISPDGKLVIASVQRVQEKDQKKFSNIYLFDSDSGESKIFTTGDQSDLNPKWSPDGKTISFISNRENEKQPQIYLISIEGGEAQKLTNFEGECLDYSWSPDGNMIICEFRRKDTEALEKEKNEDKKKLGIVSRQITRVFYRLDGYGWYPEDRRHIWKINTKTGEMEQLTNHPIFDDFDAFWSPDGKEFGYFSNQAPDPDLQPDHIDLFIFNLETGISTKLNTPVGPKGNGSFSPDGKWISYIAQIGEGEGWRNQNLWVIHKEGNTPAKNLTEKYDLHVNGNTLNDNGPAPLISPIWSTDGKWIYFQNAKHGNTSLMKINVDTEELLPVINNTGVVGKPEFDHLQTKLMYIFGQPQSLPAIFIKPMDKPNTFNQLTHFNVDWFSDLDLGELEEIWFKGSDQNDLQGWIIKPPGFDPTKKYPSILEIHGGPITQYGNFFMHEFYYLAAKGFVVYFCNPRGGTGYGEDHTKSIYDGKWGTKDFEDLMCWADHIEKQSYIDPKRMGVTGGSYGGYMTLWIIGHTNRFQAAVAQRCVSNLISMWGSSDFNWSFQQIFGDQPPYDNIDTLWENSPMKHIGRAKTPTLIIHSEQDLRCPLEQGQQAFTALKKLGVETKFVIFPDESHGLSRGGRTDRRIVRLNEISGWFDKYLK
ncbi:MAG TPA: S9 family peptidase [Anaerolineaceae bacterium]|nr:S9 family peptidase [Anaerolineaceae bacterium]